MVLARQVLKADLRQEITAFGLLDWAYRKECVRAAGEEFSYDQNAKPKETSSTGRLMNMGIIQGGGAINGLLNCHMDALLVDEFVFDSCSSHLYMLVTVNAERGAPMPRHMVIERERCGPKYKDPFSKRLVMIYEGHKQIGCELEWEGVPDEEFARQTARYENLYQDFLGLLDALPELELEKWRVSGRGA